MKVALAPTQSHFECELTGIVLSRVREDAPIEIEVPEEVIYEEWLNPITTLIERDVSSLHYINKGIEYGLLIDIDKKLPEMTAMSAKLSEEESAIQHAANARAELDANKTNKDDGAELKQRANDILSIPVNDAKIAIREITSRALLEVMLTLETKKKKPRRSLLDIINQRKRSKDVAGPGVVQIFDDDNKE